MNKQNIAIVVALAAISNTNLNAQVSFSDTLQSSSDTAWTVNHSGSDYQAVFGYDYTTVGIPQNPYLTSGSSTGLKLQVNQTAGVQQGVSISPTGLGITGDYLMTFDMFCNYLTSGAGSTQIANYGIGTSGKSAIWAGNNDGLEFGNILDNGSSTAYRGYLGSSSIGATPFAAGSQNFANAYYTSRFPSVSIPASETSIYPSQTGSSAAGTLSFQWVQVSIEKIGSTVTETINGNLIATMTGVSLTQTNVFLGLYDSNNGSANSNPDLNMVIFSNFTLDQVPEPTTYALTGLGAAGFYFMRRRQQA